MDKSAVGEAVSSKPGPRKMLNCARRSEKNYSMMNGVIRKEMSRKELGNQK